MIESSKEWQAGEHHAASQQEVESWLAVGLAMIAGFLDAYGIMTYGTYLSFMSGNTTQAGYRTAQGNFEGAVHAALAIVSFVGGSFAGALLSQSALGRIRQLVFGAIATALACIIGLAQVGYLSAGIHIAMVSFAMGAMNTALSPVGARSRVGAQSVNLTFVTGTLSRIGVHLALAARRAVLPDSNGSWHTHLRQARLLASIWAGFLTGALLSGAATPRFGVWVLSFPMLILAALAAFDRSASATA